MSLTNSKTFSRLLCTTLYYILPFVLYGQKLPNIQKESLRVPSNIRIDGKTIEWNNKFSAYNNATGIFYTICNDDINLYLVIQASDPDVLTKITNRGVVLYINTSGAKKDENAVLINYPFFDLKYGNKPYISFQNGAMLHSTRVAMEQNPDSVSRVANKKLHDNEKFIRTKGFPDVDTLLSIYNRDGINAAEAFDSKMTYTFEMSINLKLLKLDVKNKTTFSYHVVLQGLTMNDFGFTATKDANGRLHMAVAPGASAAVPKKDHLDAVGSTTDFWGEYILAKK
ncbi:MAG: hypothetical protein ABIN91_19180 [Mucilaginibacter sp.]|uniref:hypothetical protein n=1 Tax=Mucilaginibacter sp. TaxID=1882438 RepID=UPI003265D880